MVQAKPAFIVQLGGDAADEVELREDNLHEIFKLAKRGDLHDTLQVFRSGQKVGELKRLENDLWEINWHAQAEDQG